MYEYINPIKFILWFSLVAIVQITPSGDPLLGENYTLTCNVLVAQPVHLCPSVTYQWTMNNNTVTPLETPPNSLSFSPLTLSDAGQYACRVTFSLSYLNINSTTAMGMHNLKLQSKSLMCYKQYHG